MIALYQSDATLTIYRYDLKLNEFVIASVFNLYDLLIESKSAYSSRSFSLTSLSDLRMYSFCLKQRNFESKIAMSTSIGLLIIWLPLKLHSHLHSESDWNAESKCEFADSSVEIIAHNSKIDELTDMEWWFDSHLHGYRAASGMESIAIASGRIINNDAGIEWYRPSDCNQFGVASLCKGEDEPNSFRLYKYSKRKQRLEIRHLFSKFTGFVFLRNSNLVACYISNWIYIYDFLDEKESLYRRVSINRMMLCNHGSKLLYRQRDGGDELHDIFYYCDHLLGRRMGRASATDAYYYFTGISHCEYQKRLIAPLSAHTPLGNGLIAVLIGFLCSKPVDMTLFTVLLDDHDELDPSSACSSCLLM